jgi:succinate dehydrogenase / fumarate reductase membrane anchor subunit
MAPNTPNPSSMRSHLGRARGLGSAKDGVGHWWAQRVSAIALVPLSLWFASSILCLVGADYQSAREWLSAPPRLAVMGLFSIAMTYHAYLGLRVVIEDYLHGAALRCAALIGAQVACWVLGASAIAAMLFVAFGA